MARANVGATRAQGEDFRGKMRILGKCRLSSDHQTQGREGHVSRHDSQRACGVQGLQVAWRGWRSIGMKGRLSLA